MKTTKKLISAALVAMLLFAIPGCSKESVPQNVVLKYHWVDSDLFENIDLMADADIKDDFAAAVNYEWATKQVKDFTYDIGPVGDLERNLLTKKRALIDNPSVQGKNIELIRTADGLLGDWDYRNSLGVEPLKKYLGYIDEIQTLDDVSAYMLDNSKNPFALSLVKIKTMQNDSLDDSLALVVTKPDLSLEDDDNYINISSDSLTQKERVETRVKTLLKRCGYSDKEIRKIINGGFGFESKMVYADTAEDSDITKDTLSKDEVLAKAGSYPLNDMIVHYSMDKSEHWDGEFSYLSNLQNIYTEKNVEEMKQYFKFQLVLNSAPYLDREAWDLYLDTSLDRTNPFAERTDKSNDYYTFYQIGQTPLSAAFDQAYLDEYFSQETYDDIMSLISDVKEKYAIEINESTTLSEESKKAVIDKLNKMKSNVMVPDNRADFSDLTLASKEEGGSFLDALCSLNCFRLTHAGEMSSQTLKRSYWDIYDSAYSTTVVNAYYSRLQNAIFINAGILEEPFYSHDVPYEVNMGYMGTIIGHEISHAFDSLGVYRDADGKFNQLVSNEEMKNWNAMSYKIISHLSTFEPFEGSGSYSTESLISRETISDIEGIRVCLLIAKDHPDFDYDLFFRSYSEHWRHLITKSREVDNIKNDNHLIRYLRINYNLMQFDEFVETYDIKPGDGMYLDPAERIIIW